MTVWFGTTQGEGSETATKLVINLGESPCRAVTVVEMPHSESVAQAPPSNGHRRGNREQPTRATVAAIPASTAAALHAIAPTGGSIIEQYPVATPIRITTETSIVGSVAETLWQAYRTNFEPLARVAILQHCYSRDVILAELANPRIVKIVGWRGGEPVGLAMVTNSLEDVPQISPEFLRSSYPEHAAANTIYFGILVMVVPDLRGRTLFSRLYTELWQVPALAGGILVFDLCDFNRQMFNTDVLIQRIADNFPRSSVKVLDSQTWYVAELPEPIPNTRAVGF